MKYSKEAKLAGSSILMLLMCSGPAIAQSCDVTEFRPEFGEEYLTAQEQFIVDDNAAAALKILDSMRQRAAQNASSLNCYEEGAVLGLSTQVKLDLGDNLGAIEDLRAYIDIGHADSTARLNVMKAVWQLYFQENHLQEGLTYADRWMSAGGQPVRDEMWTFAIAYNGVADYSSALFWAERVLELDGADAENDVLKFVSFLYSKTDQPEKQAEINKRISE